MGYVTYVLVDHETKTIHALRTGSYSLATICGLVDAKLTRVGRWKYKENREVTCIVCLAEEEP